MKFSKILKKINVKASILKLGNMIAVSRRLLGYWVFNSFQ